MKPRELCAVLVVEDDPAIRRLLVMILTRMHLQVQTAEDGIEAVLKLGLMEYDAIILDLMMPKLDGFAFLKTIGANDPGRLRKIIVTSAASPAVIRERLTVTPFALLPKPFEIVEMRRTIERCIAEGCGSEGEAEP